MTPYKNLVRGTAVVVGLVYSAVLFLSGIELDTPAKRVLALIPSIAPLAIVAYDKWVWRWKFIQKLNHRPRVDGLWKATLVPDDESHIPSEVPRGPIEVYIVIEQSYWTLSITQFSKESRSYSRTSTFIRHGESNHTSLSYLYDNVPRQEHRRRSPRHVGACEFSTPQGSPTRLEGHYFTDRYTQGEMTLELVGRSTNFADFQGAHDYAANAPAVD